MASTKDLTIPATAYGSLLVGMLLALGGTRLDGFVGGACQGAGIALMLIAVAMIGGRMRAAKKGDDQSMWLPSRDEDEK